MRTKRFYQRFWLLTIGLTLLIFALACQTIVPSSSPSFGELPPAATVEPWPQDQVTSAIDVPADLASEEQLLVELYARVNPAVVNLTIFADQGGTIVPASQGSGFVFDQSGHIVTNAHVVHGAGQIEVTFADGTVRAAEVVGEDLNSDLAVVKVDDLPDGTGSLPLGSMESIAVGQTTIAIGNPFALQGTLTRGVVSALGRTIPGLTPFDIPQAIQTDAAINPGNSGGPLLNLRGEVIGVNAQIETGGTSRTNSGIGFAIPVSIVHVVVPDLIENGEHSWAWLGVRGSSLTPTLVKAMDLPVERGAYLAEIIDNGPSAKAGLQGASETTSVDGREVAVGGDVITAIDGQTVTSFDDLLIYIALQTGPGKEVTLNILRDGEPQEVTVKLEERPSSLPQSLP